MRSHPVQTSTANTTIEPSSAPRSNGPLVAVLAALVAAIAAVVYFAFINTSVGAPSGGSAANLIHNQTDAATAATKQ